MLTLQQSHYSTDNDSRALLAIKAKQELYYNVHAWPLPELRSDDRESVYSALWKKTCDKKIALHSYDVHVGEVTYRQNCCDIRRLS